MLLTGPTPERIALNRVTFGARDGDVLDVQRMGWSAWVEDQLHPPLGDDPTLAQYLSGQTLHIEYDAYDGPTYGWKATKEDRPLMYLGASGADLWNLADKLRFMNWAEQTRPFDELVSAIAIRNGHSRYQLREVMA